MGKSKHPGLLDKALKDVARMNKSHKSDVAALKGVISAASSLSKSAGTTARGFSDQYKYLAKLIDQYARKVVEIQEAEDQQSAAKGDKKIGTTGRGIGPSYADKASRTGLRVGDLLEPDHCAARLRAALAEKNAVMEKVHGEQGLDFDEQLATYLALGKRLAPFVGDTGAEVRRAYQDGKRVLFEGAQGIMLDIDHGTYPFVTSSNTGTAGVAAGAGFPANRLGGAVGIAKAYCTRVGEGPFPTEDHGEEGQAIRDAGNEYGATTGRPRRCGWFDAVAVRYAVELNGATGLIVTNLDVLSEFATLKVAVAYEVGGERVERYPVDADLDEVTPIYEEHTGWTDDLTAARAWDDLPAAAQAYVRRLEELVGTPIEMLSVGPERDQVIPLEVAATV